jgi:RNA polymerase sigma factor (sigma-70 family)
MMRLLRVLHAAGGSDRDLLDRYARDGDEEAFAALVRRYGAGVWAACVRLADGDAEDAFQAVFLTLARKAGSVGGLLPAWLHGVTRRVAANLRRDARRRAAVESSAARRDVAAPADPSLREGVALLDEELARLPERYRAVLVVCCLEGRSRDEAAAQLGWSQGQVKGRLERAREMLRTRLARRGVELGGLLLAASVCRPAPGLPPLAAASPAVLSLANGVIHAMAASKLKVVAAVLMLVGTAGAVTYRAGGAGVAEAPAASPEPAPAPRAEPPVKNRWEKRLEDKNLTPKQRAAYEQVAKLHTVNLPQWSDRGAFDLFPPLSQGKDSEVPTAVLYRMGVDVLPVLAEPLDDETPTATVSVNRRGDKRVWKVNELAGLLIHRIADRDFVVGEPNKEISVREIGQHPKAISELRKAVVEWHAKFAAKTPTERKLADVTDPWFRNRFDAVIWLGENKAKKGRRAIEARIDGYYDDPNRSLASLTQTEMTYCALALGQIGDGVSLRPVRRVCEDMSNTVRMCYRPKGQGRWAADSGINERLFRAYHGLTLLGKKAEAVRELNRLLDTYGSEMEEYTRKDFEKRLEHAKGL